MEAWQALAPRAKELSPEEAQQRREEMEALNGAIKDAIADGRRALWSLAALLDRFDEEDGWAALGFKSQNEWLASREIGITRGRFHDLVDTYRELVKREVEPSVIKVLEPSKVRTVLPAVRSGRASLEDALDHVKTLGFRDLRERYRDPEAGRGAPTSKPGREPTVEPIAVPGKKPVNAATGEPIAQPAAEPVGTVERSEPEPAKPEDPAPAAGATICSDCGQAIAPPLPDQRVLLRGAREAAGLSLEQVAEAVGVSQAALRGWEVGSREPGAYAAVRLAGLLGAAPEALWPPEDEPGNEKPRRPLARPRGTTASGVTDEVRRA
ncbi:MAG: helix-turn-helix domain-containing protein [Thermoleophilaceae bacterium]|nr:helix-turn-helix domain-containing protein [Thermoleophilaceae bacterium]